MLSESVYYGIKGGACCGMHNNKIWELDFGITIREIKSQSITFSDFKLINEAFLLRAKNIDDVVDAGGGVVAGEEMSLRCVSTQTCEVAR